MYSGLSKGRMAVSRLVLQTVGDNRRWVLGGRKAPWSPLRKACGRYMWLVSALWDCLAAGIVVVGAYC